MALPHLLERGRGTIVSICSVNAVLPDPLVIDYGAATAALLNFSKSSCTMCTVSQKDPATHLRIIRFGW